MSTEALFHEIESLPESLRREVAEFVAFLKFKRLEARGVEEFTAEECAEFERRWAEFETDPTTGVEAFEAMRQIRAGHGL